MITAARPMSGEASHYYTRKGEACYEVPNKSKPGTMRKTTIRDCRALNLLPSVTTITKILHREAIVQYTVEQAILAVLSSPKRENESLDDFVERIIHTDREHEQERDIAAERGKQIHWAIRQSLWEGGFDLPLENLLYPYVHEPIAFLRKLGRCVGSEQTVVAPEYAGMLDLLIENDAELWLFDIKSCRRIPDKQYEENRLQLGAYSGALGNVGDLRIRCANLYISTKEPGQWKIIESENWKQDYDRFLLLTKFFRLTNGLACTMT